jgi:hypothetical protein
MANDWQWWFRQILVSTCSTEIADKMTKSSSCHQQLCPQKHYQELLLLCTKAVADMFAGLRSALQLLHCMLQCPVSESTTARKQAA